jgi:hypothetical protein
VVLVAAAVAVVVAVVAAAVVVSSSSISTTTAINIPTVTCRTYTCSHTHSDMRLSCRLQNVTLTELVHVVPSDTELLSTL